MYMDNIKQFAENEKELETLIQTIRIYNHYIGMEYGTEKYAMLIMKSGKRQIMEGRPLLNQERIRTLGENAKYKYLGIFEAVMAKPAEMKENIRKEYSRQLLKTKLCSRNFIKWTKEEIRQMDQRTRKLMMMHIDRLWVSRKEGGRGLTNIEDRVDASIQRLEDYIKKSKEKLITTTSNSSDNVRTNRTTITKKQK